VFVKYGSHDEAKRCVERENGKKSGLGALGGVALVGKTGDGEEIRVVFDGEGVKLKAVLKELDDRRKREREEKRRRERERDGKAKENVNGNASGSGAGKTSTPTPQTPNQWRPGHGPPLPHRPQGPPHLRPQGPPHLNHPPHHPLPQNPTTAANSHFSKSRTPQLNGRPPSPNSNLTHALPSIPAPMPARVRRPPPALVRARIMTSQAVSMHTSSQLPPPHQPHSSSSSTPVQDRGRAPAPGQYHHRVPLNHYHPSPMAMSRSPSPILQPRMGIGFGSKPVARHHLEKEHEGVVAELARNGKDHVKLDGGAQLGGAVREEDVVSFFEGFKVDKVCDLLPEG
jgi:hypothetical protein